MPIDRGPFNALVDDDGTGLTGTVWNKTQIQNVLLDPIDLIGAWVPYTAAWTSIGAAPALGNGSLAAAYTQISRTIHFRIVLTFGSTSTPGGGYWYFSLPVASIQQSRAAVGTAYANKPSVGDQVGTVLQEYTADKVLAMTPANQPIGPGVPWAWAANDFFTLCGTYQLAG